MTDAERIQRLEMIVAVLVDGVIKQDRGDGAGYVDRLPGAFNLPDTRSCEIAMGLARGLRMDYCTHYKDSDATKADALRVAEQLKRWSET